MDDLAAVASLLGRTPQGAFEVMLRAADGTPIVIRNAPLLDDGTPMPTRFWLVGPTEVRAVSQLEAAGGVRRAEAEIDPALVEAAHRRYEAERDAAMPVDWTGPRPSGGIGGTRTGVKCLHAHYAWHLVGGDDPVGAWVDTQLATTPQIPDGELVVRLTDGELVLATGGWSEHLPIGAEAVCRLLGHTDPPSPVDLTNAIGAVADHLDDVLIAHPELREGGMTVRLCGSAVAQVARVEIGSADVEWPQPLARDAAEEVFRLVATECRDDRSHNPGLAADHVDTVVAACCLVVATMRRLHLSEVTIEP
jgi:uncharacterized protein